MDAVLSFATQVDVDTAISLLSGLLTKYRSGPRMTMFRWQGHMVSAYGGGNADVCNIQIKADSISAIIATYSRIRERIVLGCNYKADFMMQLGVVVLLHPRPLKFHWSDHLFTRPYLFQGIYS